MADKMTKNQKTKAQAGYEIPTLRNPLKTWWGKVIVIIIPWWHGITTVYRINYYAFYQK